MEGEAARVGAAEKLQLVADAYLSKYGKDWLFEVDDVELLHRGGRALVFEVAPSTAFGFRKGDFSQTRWRF